MKKNGGNVVINKVVGVIRKLFFSENLQMQEILSSVSAAFVLRVVGAGASFGVNIMIARLLGADGSGIYYLAVTITGIAKVISRLGLDNTLLRFTATYAAKEEWGNVRDVYRKGLLLAGSVATVAAIIIFIAAGWVAETVFTNYHLADPLRIMACSIPSVALISLYTYLLKGLEEIRYAMLLQGFGVPVLTIPLLFLLVPGWEVEGAALSYLVASATTLAVGHFLWWSSTPRLSEYEGSVSLARILRSSLPLLWVTSMHRVIRWTDTLLLGVWMTSSAVGIYEAAIKTSMVTNLVLAAVNSVASPKYAAMYSDGDKEGLQRLVQGVTVLLFLLVIPIVLVFFSVPGYVMKIFGPEFVEGKQILVILTVGEFVAGVLGTTTYLLIMSGREITIRNLTTVAAAANLILNALLIPAFEVVGAAIATTVSNVILNAGAAYLAHREVGVSIIPRMN
jgi:O-antigen/teichoic acid export membrane protein